VVSRKAHNLKAAVRFSSPQQYKEHNEKSSKQKSQQWGFCFMWIGQRMILLLHMSLQEKLSQMSGELEEKRRAEEKLAEEKRIADEQALKEKELADEKEREEQEAAAKDAELAPVRANISSLEESKWKADLIRNSMPGMKQYAADVEGGIEKEGTTLDTLINTHKDALQTAGVENREQLVAHPEFGQEPEVENFNKAVNAGAEVAEADNSLRQKLIDLGIEVPAEKFSYDTAGAALAEHIPSIDEKLILEKLKTPEGREEAVEMLSEQIEGSMEKNKLVLDERTGEFKFSTAGIYDYDKKDVVISKGTVTVAGNSNVSFIPKASKALEATYGEDVVKEATMKAYKQSVEMQFEKFDNEHEHVKDMLKDLERVNPRKAALAYGALDKFERANYNFKRQVTEKFDQVVKENNLMSKDRNGLFEVTDDMQRLGRYVGDEQKISNAIQNSGKFPPAFDWEKLAEKIDKRSGQNAALLETVSNIKTQEELDRFLNWNASGNKPDTEGSIGKMAKDYNNESEFLQTDKYHEGNGAINARFKVSFADNSYPYEYSNKIVNKFSSYAEAIHYYENKDADFDAMKSKVIETIEKGIEQEHLQTKLAQEVKGTGFGGSIHDIENEIASINRNKETATGLFKELYSADAMLPEGEIVFQNNTFIVPALGAQLEELKSATEAKRNELRSKSAELNAKKNNPPGLFGSKSKWQSEVDELTREERDLNNAVSRMGGPEYNELANKARVPMRFPYSSPVQDMLKQETLKGTKQEVLDAIRAKLTEIVDKKAPESVMKLYEQYKQAKQ
jgi:hypothetical protein